jgi:hypothetical protein
MINFELKMQERVIFERSALQRILLTVSRNHFFVICATGASKELDHNLTRLFAGNCNPEPNVQAAEPTRSDCNPPDRKLDPHVPIKCHGHCHFDHISTVL